MKYTLWKLLLVFLMAGFAAADTLSVTYVNYAFRATCSLGGVCESDGDARYLFEGPQLSLQGDDCAICGIYEFCTSLYGIMPNNFVVPHVSTFIPWVPQLTEGNIQLGGNWYSARDLWFEFSESYFEGAGFRLPPAGKTFKEFTVTVPAKFGAVSGDATWGSDPAMPFELIIPPGKLMLKFDYDPL